VATPLAAHAPGCSPRTAHTIQEQQTVEWLRRSSCLEGRTVTNGTKNDLKSKGLIFYHQVRGVLQHARITPARVSLQSFVSLTSRKGGRAPLTRWRRNEREEGKTRSTKMRH
jgi:hypothetical protein